MVLTAFDVVADHVFALTVIQTPDVVVVPGKPRWTESKTQSTTNQLVFVSWIGDAWKVVEVEVAA